MTDDTVAETPAPAPARPHDTASVARRLEAILLIFGAQFTLFAMWFDMDAGSRRRP